MEGRGVAQTESSRTFCSVAEIFLSHRTSRVRSPPLQLLLHSDHSPVLHLTHAHIKPIIITHYKYLIHSSSATGDVTMLYHIVMRYNYDVSKIALTTCVLIYAKLEERTCRSFITHVGGQGSMLHILFLSLGLFFLSQKWL